MDLSCINVECKPIDKLYPFKIILEHLMAIGWQTINNDLYFNKIVMNKKYYELHEINIEYKNSFYHFSLPVNNSIYSYYTKIADEQQSIDFIISYIDSITS